MRDPEIGTRDTLEFKGIQISQVLEAHKERSKPVTFELI